MLWRICKQWHLCCVLLNLCAFTGCRLTVDLPAGFTCDPVLAFVSAQFLVDKQGNVVQRFSSVADPIRDIAPAVTSLLQA